VDADAQALLVRHRQQVIKRLPLRGLHGGPVPFAAFLALRQAEARAGWRAWGRRQVAAWGARAHPASRQPPGRYPPPGWLTGFG